MAEGTRVDGKLTLAELCEAIAEGKVGYTVSDGCYQVKPQDARRLRFDVDDLSFEQALRLDTHDDLSGATAAR